MQSQISHVAMGDVREDNDRADDALMRMSDDGCPWPLPEKVRPEECPLKEYLERRIKGVQ